VFIAGLIFPDELDESKVPVFIKPVWFVEMELDRINLQNSNSARPVQETLQGSDVVQERYGEWFIPDVRIESVVAPFAIAAIEALVKLIDRCRRVAATRFSRVLVVMAVGGNLWVDTTGRCQGLGQCSP